MIAPDASTAVFFLTGLLLANPLWFVLFSIEAIALDGIALGLVGVADACMTVGYWLLFAGYAALWYAGRFARGMEKLRLREAGTILGLVALGVMAFFMLSNVGYYYGGGFDESLGAAEYVSRVSRYFPMYFLSTLVYVAAGIAALMIAIRFAAAGRFAAR